MRYLLLALAVLTACQERVDTGKYERLSYWNGESAKSAYHDNKLDSCLIYLNLSEHFRIPGDTTQQRTNISIRYQVYLALNKPDSAIIDLEQLVRWDTTNRYYQQTLAYLYGEVGKYKQGMALYERLWRNDSSDIYLLNGLAACSAETGAYGNAIRYANKGLNLIGDSAIVGTLLNNLGYAQVKSGAKEAGLHLIRRSFLFLPDNPAAFYNLGRLYRDMGDENNAALSFKKVDSLNAVQQKRYQHFVLPEDDEDAEGAATATGVTELIFRGEFSDSVMVLLNNKAVDTILLHSSDTSKHNINITVDYAQYKELPRITVVLMEKRESMFFYPVGRKQEAHINHYGINDWDVTLSNNVQFLY